MCFCEAVPAHELLPELPLLGILPVIETGGYLRQSTANRYPEFVPWRTGSDGEEDVSVCVSFAQTRRLSPPITHLPCSPPGGSALTSVLFPRQLRQTSTFSPLIPPSPPSRSGPPAASGGPEQPEM
ncbi:hypothetical protein ACER0C_016124 [Sarotherodon galilaeus]